MTYRELSGVSKGSYTFVGNPLGGRIPEVGGDVDKKLCTGEEDRISVIVWSIGRR